MVEEVLSALRVKPDGAYIDCTVGEGGHAEALLGRVDLGVRLLGIDLDQAALSIAADRLGQREGRVTLAQGSFASLERLARRHEFVPAAGVVFDLGVSSLQLESPERGFSFSRMGPLDMRFDVGQRETADHLVNRQTEVEIAEIIHRLGEERSARRIARAIVQARPIKDTIALASAVVRGAARPVRGRTHAATRTFQALRMAVNDELKILRSGLEQAIQVLEPGGMLAVISYHSLEDRLVKRHFQRESSDCICPPGIPECRCDHKATIRVITRRVLRPTEAEVSSNPRARSARLRVAERL